MLPRVKIAFLSGALGLVGQSPDGLVALAVGAAQVSDTFALNTVYTLRRASDLDKLGVTAINNPVLTRHVQDYYREAGDGSELIIYGLDKAQTMTQLCNPTTGGLRDLITKANGRLRGILVARDAVVGESPAGIEADVLTAIPQAQELAEWATASLYAPLMIILEGRGLTGKSLKDLGTMSCNRVGVLVGDTTAESKGACVGLLAGRIAKTAVHRHIGRVEDGALASRTMYLAGKSLEESLSLIEELHAKRYITPRSYVGRTGYYLADDNLATANTDDYGQMANRRVIDKAYRIAYNTLLGYMLDDIDLNEDGTMQAAVLKSWEAGVITAIKREMVGRGELSAGEGAACRCIIDPAQDVVSTSRITATLQVRPHGYARYIDVALGFLVKQS